MITIPILAVVIQSVVLIIALITIAVRLTNKISKIESKNDGIKDDFKTFLETNLKLIDKVESVNSRLIKMENISTDVKRNQDRIDELYKNKDIVLGVMNDIKVQLVEIKTEMKIKLK